MRKKIALLSFLEGEGPWIRAVGNESSAEVHGLADSEILCLEVEGKIGGRHLKIGANELDYLAAGQMYRFTKVVPEGQRPTKTSVEVMLNGSSSSRSDAGAKRS